MKQAYCEFIKPVNFKNGYIAQTKFPIEETVTVMITDISKDWQLPLIVIFENDTQGVAVNKVNNPKLKTISKDDFYKTFKITLIE